MLLWAPGARAAGAADDGTWVGTVHLKGEVLAPRAEVDQESFREAHLDAEWTARLAGVVPPFGTSAELSWQELAGMEAFTEHESRRECTRDLDSTGSEVFPPDQPGEGPPALAVAAFDGGTEQLTELHLPNVYVVGPEHVAESGPPGQCENATSEDQGVVFSDYGGTTHTPLEEKDPTKITGHQVFETTGSFPGETIREVLDWHFELLGAPDTDGDGLSDYLEVVKYGTDPSGADTDGDGFSDGEEVAAGTDPLDPSSHPGASSGGGGGAGGGGGGLPGGGGASAPGGGPPPAAEEEEEPEPSGDLVLDCGRAGFEYFYVTEESTGIRPGDRVCAVLASNSVARELLAQARGGFADLAGVFGSYFLEYYAMHFDHLSEEAAEAYVRHYVSKRLQPVNLASSLIKGLFPNLEDAFAETDAFVVIGKAAALTAVPVAASFEADQIADKGACAGFLMDLDPDRLSVSGNLVYNPTHVVDPGSDGYLTRMWTFEREARHLRPDKFRRRNFSLTCAADGSARRDSPRDNTKLLEGAKIAVIGR
jgi:hypothetical protein